MRMATRLRAVLMAAAALASGAGGTAHAVDLRSWDQKIDDAAKRYVVLAAFNNQAVLDKETQLVWFRQAASAMTWNAAVQFCLVSNTAGRSGWRLPSFSELSSLLGAGARLPAGHPFTGIPSSAGFFWSGTSDYDVSRAVTRQLTNLEPVYARTAPKTFSNHVLCVRGDGAADGFRG